MLSPRIALTQCNRSLKEMDPTGNVLCVKMNGTGQDHPESQQYFAKH